MLDLVPNDILFNIIKKLESNDTIYYNEEIFTFYEIGVITILNLKRINKYFYSFINSLRGSWKKIPTKGFIENKIDEKSLSISKKRSSEIDILCKKKTSVKTFKWLMENNIFFSLGNIKNLIIYNRIDVIKCGFFYKEVLDILFNRFYIDNTKHNEIFSISENINPITVASEYGRLNIIQLLLEVSTHGNPFLYYIPSILDLSIKYNYKSILSYVLINHYSKVKNIIEYRIVSIIYRIDKSEDILFYLLITKNLVVTEDILLSIITKKYYDLFVYCVLKNNVKINYEKMIYKSIETDSDKILNFLRERQSKVIIKIPKSFLSRRKYNTESLLNLIKNHLDIIPKDYGIIRILIEYNIPNEYIYPLIDKEYIYNETDIINSINNRNISLAKYLINNFSLDEI